MQASARLLLIAAVLLAGCTADAGRGRRLFEKLSPSETNVAFRNDLAEGPSFNILNFLYYYDGGGVAVGDVDGNGLPDLYFTANEQPNRLYLNRGDFRFEDVTDAAGVAGEGNWTTGATMADVNGDGLLDLYVTVIGGFLDRVGRNQLFVNRGDGTFAEEAEAYGLAFQGYSTQAAFFDYDRDGDLDVYLLNHSVHSEGTYEASELREVPHPRAGDRLYRNDPDSTRPGARRFTDVSAEAGIYSGVVGYGLGIVVSDLNVDGCPDVYVANDFHENDYLYYNNCDGTFTESIRYATGHNSRSSMGVDAGDVNGDGLPDVVVLDMLPEREDIRKTSDEAEPMEVAELKVKFGYYHQYVRNMLQLNRGQGRFSEIGQLAGIAATDWSWAPLLADLDNDGRQDLFVTSGIYRRPNDLDFVNVISRPDAQAALADGIDPEDLKYVEAMPQVRLPNHAFRNDGDLSFTDVGAAWGLDDDAFANGAAYADLDDDGDLDLITNNINAPAAIFRNLTRERTGRHYLTVTLRGSGANPFGVGARVMVKQGDTLQVRELYPTRGYQSSVDPRLHFGLGDTARVDSLVVVWPDGRFQALAGVEGDRQLVLRQDDASGVFRYPPAAPAPPLFEDVTDAVALDYRHRENAFGDFSREATMPHKLSLEGPALAVGDVDGDGLDDVFAGGAKWQPARLLLQRPGGTFEPSDDALWQADSLYEDVDAAFFDADGDGDLDLFVASGGNEFWGNAEALRHRLYRNENGRFRRDRAAVPDVFTQGGCVAPADFDGDGDVDLFVGSRVVSRAYGEIPPSFLLENDGTGRFTDVTAVRAPDLTHAGMVADAAWTDTDGDGAPDLVVAGEWMPVRVFHQENGRFTDHTAAAGLAGTTGWWNALVAADLDGDGDDDLVGGNLGLNSRIRASADEPARLYRMDFDGNGTTDPVLEVYRHGEPYPVATVEDLAKQIPALHAHYRTFADFGARRVADLLPGLSLGAATIHEATTFATTYFENRGDGTFAVHVLPPEAQFSPVYALLPGDYDGDGRTDLLAAGNFSGVRPQRGRYDASYGLLLRGVLRDDARGDSATFRPVQPGAAGLFLTGDVRALRRLRRADGTVLLLAARNDDRLQVVRLRPAAPPLAARAVKP